MITSMETTIMKPLNLVAPKRLTHALATSPVTLLLTGQAGFYRIVGQ